jgi:hypothetical protein
VFLEPQDLVKQEGLGVSIRRQHMLPVQYALAEQAALQALVPNAGADHVEAQAVYECDHHKLCAVSGT